jgi:glycosyltransferase involved in cell wall biosynthesis
MYDIVLKELPDKVEKLVKPIDSLFTDFQKIEKYNIYSLKPHLVWQDSIFSDIENKSQDLDFLRPAYRKISLIISSYNQKKRLKFSLQSAIKQSYYNYEVIVADDNSDDGTLEMIKDDFPGVKVSLNPYSEKNTYTLAQNWNAAAKMATGERLIFTNADCIFPIHYVKSHADKEMINDIIFGPNERTNEEIDLLLDNCDTTKDLLEEYIKVGTIDKDLRHDSSAYTYNKQYSYFYPWGNNMSVPAKEFFEVGGFPLLREYGGEEILLSKKLATKKSLLIKSNVNTKNIHLWHPVTNKMDKPFNENKYTFYLNN